MGLLSRLKKKANYSSVTYKETCLGNTCVKRLYPYKNYKRKGGLY
jgi:hypothetical protein